MDTWFAVSLVVGATALVAAALLGARRDRRQPRAQILLPTAPEQARNRGLVRYHIDVQDSSNG